MERHGDSRQHPCQVIRNKNKSKCINNITYQTAADYTIHFFRTNNSVGSRHNFKINFKIQQSIGTETRQIHRLDRKRKKSETLNSKKMKDFSFNKQF